MVFGGNSWSWTDPCSSPIATYFPDADTVAHVELKGATSGCRGQWNVCHFNWGIRGSSSSSISAEGTMQITKSSFARATAANLKEEHYDVFRPWGTYFSLSEKSTEVTLAASPCAKPSLASLNLLSLSIVKKIKLFSCPTATLSPIFLNLIRTGHSLINWPV